MIFNYIVVFLVGVAAGAFFVSLLTAANDTEEVDKAYYQGYVKGRKDFYNEIEGKI